MRPKRLSSSDTVLGIGVTGTTVAGVLMRRAGERLEVTEQFVESRELLAGVAGGGGIGDVVGAGAMATMDMAPDLDVSFQMGGIDLGGSGFGSFETGAAMAPSAPAAAAPFQNELLRLLTDSAAAGVKDPALAFCMGAPDVRYVELEIDPNETAPKTPFWKRSQRMAVPEPDSPLGRAEQAFLRTVLAREHADLDVQRRTGFLRMTPHGGRQRFLAIVPHLADASTTTLRSLAGEALPVTLRPLYADAEVSTYAHLVATLDADDGALLDPVSSFGSTSGDGAAPPTRTRALNTAVIRVRREDTLILFMRGDRVHHAEELRTVTLFDEPSTIVSRIALQQDQCQFGEVDRLFFQGGTRPERLEAALRHDFPHASVLLLQHLLQEHRVFLPPQTGTVLNTAVLEAVGVGARLLAPDEEERPRFNLMPSALLPKRAVSLRIGWLPAILLVVLFAASLFSILRYVDARSDLEQRRIAFATNPPPAPAMPAPLVQAQLDSLGQIVLRRGAVVTVLDTLLHGSDRWSRFLETVSLATDDTRGLWLTAWTARPDGSVRIEGAATSRYQIADFARRTGATVDRVFSIEVAERTVYSFLLTAPVPSGAPEVSLYLQAQSYRMEGDGAPPLADPMLTESALEAEHAD